MNDSKAMTKARAGQAMANATLVVLLFEDHVTWREAFAVFGLSFLFAAVQIGYDAWRASSKGAGES